MWRSGHALRPYFRDVKTVVRNKAMFPDLQGFDIVDLDRLRFVHFPIRDCSITDDDRVLELARSLVRAISEGEIIYLHCWGGHGRTGTMVCIMLHLMYAVSQIIVKQCTAYSYVINYSHPSFSITHPFMQICVC
jgi:protein-tyrosine phosphatase